MVKQWKARLVVSIDGQTITPITDISPNFNTPNIPEHSLEADNVMVTKTNDTFAFSMTIKAVSDEESGDNAAKKLTELQLKHTEFQVVLQERKTTASGDKEWSFDRIAMEHCYINSGSPTRASIAGSPVAVYNCIALGVTVDGAFYDGTLTPPTVPEAP